MSYAYRARYGRVGGGHASTRVRDVFESLVAAGAQPATNDVTGSTRAAHRRRHGHAEGVWPASHRRRPTPTQVSAASPTRTTGSPPPRTRPRASLGRGACRAQVRHRPPERARAWNAGPSPGAATPLQGVGTLHRPSPPAARRGEVPRTGKHPLVGGS